ncbi:hypothetical protein HK104_008177 [Borealophlyctis nickersoniae]|nr:hypothetical protein HK104_008177 [Borealophlyctis nickersoniae]
MRILFGNPSRLLFRRAMSSTPKHRVLLTRRLPPQAQARLESIQDIDLIKWDNPDTPIPRSDLLKHVKEGVEGLLVLLTEKIDEEVLEAAGERLKVVSTMSGGFS